MTKSLFAKILFSFGFLVTLSSILLYPLVRAQVATDLSAYNQTKVERKADINSKQGTVKKVEYTSTDLRDPFRSSFEMQLWVEQIEEKQARQESPAIGYNLPQLEVQGMVWGASMSQAIINNTVVRVGEVIKGAEVLDIRKEGVYVLYEGRPYILRPTIQKK